MPAIMTSETIAEPHVATSGLRVLVLDDSRVDRRRIERMCREAELAVDIDEAATLGEFTEMLSGSPYDIFLIDYRLGEGDGLIALEVLSRHPSQRSGVAIMVAGEGQIQVAVDAMKAGCEDFLLKDHLTADVLARSISNAMGRSLKSQNGAAPFKPASVEARHFSREHGSEMRTILAGMLRHVRTLRRAGGPEEALEGVEASTARLWNFLEALKVSEREGRERNSAQPAPVVGAIEPKRLM